MITKLSLIGKTFFRRFYRGAGASDYEVLPEDHRKKGSRSPPPQRAAAYPLHLTAEASLPRRSICRSSNITKL